MKLSKTNFPILYIPQFPHFPRIFSAGNILRILKYLGVLFISLFILVNLLYDLTFYKDPEKKLRQEILRYPFVIDNHEQLGLFYLKKNLSAARQEYYLAQDLYDPAPSSNQVLGVSTSPLQKWLDIASQSEKIKNEIVLWEKTKDKYPEYLYAYLELADLHFILGENHLSKESLADLLKKSPTDKTALEFYAKIP